MSDEQTAFTFISERAALYQQRVEELATAITRQQQQAAPDYGLIALLDAHRIHWQTLARGAQSFMQRMTESDGVR
jgi:hypothetical protein